MHVLVPKWFFSTLLAAASIGNNCRRSSLRPDPFAGFHNASTRRDTRIRPKMAAERSEFETEVRELVSRVLTGVLDGVAPSADPQAHPTSLTDAAERIAIGADHGGFSLKTALVSKLIEAGHTVEDVGTDGPEACDYPDFAHAVARQVVNGNCTWGIMIDGAGIGSAMVANKVPGVRAAACYDLSTARKQPRAQPRQRPHPGSGTHWFGAGLADRPGVVGHAVGRRPPPAARGAHQRNRGDLLRE